MSLRGTYMPEPLALGALHPAVVWLRLSSLHVGPELCLCHGHQRRGRNREVMVVLGLVLGLVLRRGLVRRLVRRLEQPLELRRICKACARPTRPRPGKRR